jgi:hypothetical protein
MTLNYVVTEDTVISEGDEMFLPITIEKAYALGIEERPIPTPQPVLVQQPIVAPTSVPVPSPSSSIVADTVVDVPTPPTTTVNVPTPANTTISSSLDPNPAPSDTGPYANQVVATWRDGSTQVSNGFYK